MNHHVATFFFCIIIALTTVSPQLIAQESFKTYYTKMDASSFWSTPFRAGAFADIIVQFDNNKRFYFWRASSYLPRWEVPSGQVYVDQAPFDFSGDGEGLNWDKLCRHSHVRIIESNSSQSIIHWRYAPKFDTGKHPVHPNWRGWVDEYYTIRPDQTVTREIYDHDNSTLFTYELILNNDGTISTTASTTQAFVSSEPEYNSSSTFTTGPDLEFGAKYTKLGYSGAWYIGTSLEDTWNDNWQVGDHPDIVVNFDNNPTKWVFWRGTGFVGQMVSENGSWFNNEFNEFWTDNGVAINGGAEPMSDKDARYAHCRLIENTPARVVVQMRYALVPNEYGLINTSFDSEGWGDFSDFYFYIYPDGTAVSYNQLWTGSKNPANPFNEYEWHETIVVNPPGTEPYQNIDTKNTYTLAKYNGNIISFDMDPNRASFSSNSGNYDTQVNYEILRINLLNTNYDPFTIVEEGAELGIYPYYDPGSADYQGFNRFSHWPVNNYEAFGYVHPDASLPSHTSLSHMYPFALYESTSSYASKILLTGITDITTEEVVEIANVWKTPPSITGISGINSSSYNKKQKAYILEASSSNISFSVSASASTKSINPAFVVKKWTGGRATVKINGVSQVDGTDFKQGFNTDTDGSESLILWLDETSTSNYTVTIDDAKTPKYQLGTTATKGTVSPATGYFYDGEVVPITATPELGFKFSGWSGDLVSTSNPVEVHMDAHKTITANFVSVNTYDLAVDTTGQGFVIPASGTYNENEKVTVIAKANPGWQFHNWSGDISGSERVATITMNSNKSIKANFSKIPISQGLIHHWPLNEGSGKVAIDVIGGKDASLAGITWASFEKGHAVYLDGIDDHIQLSNIGSLKEFTITMWVKLKKYGNQSSLFHSNGWESGDLHWLLFDNGASLLSIKDSKYTSFEDNMEFIPDNFNLNEWHLITLGYNSQTGKTRIYSDNILTYNDYFSVNPQPISLDGQIGGWDRGGRNTEVLVDDVRIYNRLLSHEEVFAIYENYQPENTEIITTVRPKTGFQLYPNPAKKYVKIESEIIRDGVEVVLLDFYGKVILEKNYQSPNGAIQISTSKLKEGIYFIRISKDDQDFTLQKLIIRG